MVTVFREVLQDGDPTTCDRDPPTYRSPNGMLENLYLMGTTGQKLFHARQITRPVFIANPKYDGRCRDTDMDVFCHDLYRTSDVTHGQAKNSTHYLLLDRPERGRAEFPTRLDESLN
ncbi:hypothetical protein [Devosia faecipullorum]|uniref:hypothetical protein n=1 Tax=Devosia faecipullorum TaxID=2755039 RepID=UPI00187B78FC|nr:hypothetical protein [Devosia faecipullorum]MBE7734273.1 hypothetical protein [Devosia faecipullorum]